MVFWHNSTFGVALLSLGGWSVAARGWQIGPPRWFNAHRVSFPFGRRSQVNLIWSWWGTTYRANSGRPHHSMPKREKRTCISVCVYLSPCGCIVSLFLSPQSIFPRGNPANSKTTTRRTSAMHFKELLCANSVRPPNKRQAFFYSAGEKREMHTTTTMPPPPTCAFYWADFLWGVSAFDGNNFLPLPNLFIMSLSSAFRRPKLHFFSLVVCAEFIMHEFVVYTWVNTQSTCGLYLPLRDTW